MTRQSAADSGTVIWDRLARGTKLTRKQILTLEDLTPSQFERGRRWIIRQFQGEQEQPLVYDPREHTYSLADGWEEFQPYAMWTGQGLISRTRAFAESLATAGAAFPDSPAAGRVKRDAARLVDDVEDMLREVANHHSAA